MKFLVVLLIHGGGFLIGSPGDVSYYGQELTARGIASQAVSYRMDSAAHELADVRRAVHSAKRRYRHVLIVGWSAGGTLALRASQSIPLDATAAIEPVIDVPEWELSNPQLNTLMGPTGRYLLDPRSHGCPQGRSLIVHGDADTVAPYADSVAFARRCKLPLRTRHGVGHWITNAYWLNWFTDLNRRLI